MKTRRRKNSKRITRRKNKRKIRGGALESMPQLCFGTAQDNFEKMLELALQIGYRHIDGADAYSGWQHDYFETIRQVLEKVSSEAESPIKREELWITWKGEPKSIEEIRDTISKLNCEYIDLYLIHGWRKQWPMMDILMQAKDEKLIRNYGVSNCENIKDIGILKSEKYDIYANQIQARPPSGKIAGRPDMSPKFIEQCNALKIKIMLFATISGYQEANDINPEIISEINKYYLQKYIQDKEKGNVLMVSSVSGRSLQINYDDFKTIEKEEELLLPAQMAEIEAELKKSKLKWMGKG